MPAASPTPSNSAVDLDSLCNRFAASLVIDENPQRPRQPKPSIFSLPVIAGGEHNGYSRPKLSKRKPSRAEALQKPSTNRSSIPPPKATKPRQLSIPPSFPSPFTRTKPTPRKASAPAHVSTSRRTPHRNLQDCPPHHLDDSPPPPNTLTDYGLDTYSHLGPSTPPLYSQSQLGSTLDRTTHTPQGLSHSPAGPATPPTLPPDLFSELIIVPSTPVRLSPGSSLMPIADPFLQFQSQYDYFSDPSLVSPFDCSGSAPGFATGSFFSKSTLDAPLWADHSYAIPTPMPSDPFENNHFNTYTVS